jgi:glycerol kinase
MKTAVEWLIEQLTNRQNEIINDLSHLSLDQIYNIANKMFEQQIIEACNQEEFFGSYGYGICDDLTKGEQYYNETFKKDEL